MFEEIWAGISHFFTSRITWVGAVFCLLAAVLLWRCFDLQIIHGQEYLEKFVLETEKTRDIPSTRGNILDRNGQLLAYNDLAYAVKIEDVFESNRQKNININSTLDRLIDFVEAGQDQVVTDFPVSLDQNGRYVYTLEGSALLRFLADVYGHTAVGDLTEEQRASTPRQVMDFLAKAKGGFAIGQYEDPEDSGSAFLPGQGYSPKKYLQMVTLRYAMKLTSFRKYVGTTVATDVGESTVALIMENISLLPGVSIEENTVRRYKDAKYFSHILGYTGKISSEEMEILNQPYSDEEELPYQANDVVGKGGIEAHMEGVLRGSKGQEKVSVNNTGKVTSLLSRTEPVAGQDVWLTIDAKLQKAAYDILEQRLAGILLDKLIHAKEFVQGERSSADIKIPSYDVYFALINNQTLDITAFAAEGAGEAQTALLAAHEEYKLGVYANLGEQLGSGASAYKDLPKEYQVYESLLVSMMQKSGFLQADKIPAEHPVQTAWAKEESLSLAEYLRLAIENNWVDVSLLNMDTQYSDMEAVYKKIAEYSISLMESNLEFQKRMYKYMLLQDVISPTQICEALCEQGRVEIPESDREALYQGRLSAFEFVRRRIEALDITPAQLALDPCNGSMVITDVHSGQVLAMVSYPGFDNNQLANTVNAEYYAKLLSDKSSPSLNYATQYKAAPGSTFKMVMAGAGLMEGAISTDTQVDCVGTFTDITPSPRCWLHSGHGHQDVCQAIENSCNYFFFQLGYNLSFYEGSYQEQKGLDILAAYASQFGLDQKSGVEISEYEPDISKEDPVRSAIGQGSFSFTTAALARYTAALANGGDCYKLSLLSKISDKDGVVLKEYEKELGSRVEMPAEYWNLIWEGMRRVVEKKSYFSDLAVQVAGKTGTAQQISTRPNHALFVAFAPYEQPELAIATRIPFGYSSDYAAQTTRDLIRYYYGLAPEEELLTGTAERPDAGASTQEY